MEYKVKAYNIWEVGQKRDENGMPHQEDALFPDYGACSPEDRLFVLCDGMGGHDNGEIASSVVCKALSQSVIRRLRASSGVFKESIFDTALKDAYDALDVNDTDSPKKMGTTMALLCLYEKGYFMAHIGDTRIYHIRPGDDEGSTQIIFATRDHSLVNKLVDSGKMRPGEALASTRRHVITRALQPHMEERPKADVEISSDIRSGDYFFMCTHGMFENLSDSTIKQIFSRQGGKDGDKFRELRAVTAGNRDNHSAIIVHIEAVMSSRPVTRVNSGSDVARQPVSKNQESIVNSSKRKIKDTTRSVINRAGSGGDLRQLICRFMIALMLLLTLIMVIYYAFIRNDEAMLEAGRSYDSPAAHEEYDPYRPDEERYGYETKETEVIDDRIIDDNTADVQEETVVEDINSEVSATPETAEPDKAPETAAPAAEPTQAPAPEPVQQPDMPILQE